MFNRFLEKVKSLGSLRNSGDNPPKKMASGRAHNGTRERVKKHASNSCHAAAGSETHNSAAAILDGGLDGPDATEYKSIYKLRDLDLKVTLGKDNYVDCDNAYF